MATLTFSSALSTRCARPNPWQFFCYVQIHSHTMIVGLFHLIYYILLVHCIYWLLYFILLILAELCVLSVSIDAMQLVSCLSTYSSLIVIKSCICVYRTGKSETQLDSHSWVRHMSPKLNRFTIGRVQHCMTILIYRVMYSCTPSLSLYRIAGFSL